MKKMIAALLSAALMLTAGCASEQPAKDPAVSEQTSSATEPTAGEDTDDELMQKFFEAHRCRNILEKHQNMEEHVVYFDAQGNEVNSVYRYMDSEMQVWDNGTYLQLVYPDRWYERDPERSEKVTAFFAMDGIMEKEWEVLFNDYFDFHPDEEDEITGRDYSKEDGRITLTLACPATETSCPIPELWGEIEPGTQDILEVTIDSETYMPYEMFSYLKKTDGTTVRMYEGTFSYDVPTYTPSEEMLEVMNGTDNTLHLVADPGTEQERTYTISCGKNGNPSIVLADGYNRRYRDAACTQEELPSENLLGEPVILITGEQTLYTVNES